MLIMKRIVPCIFCAGVVFFLQSPLQAQLKGNPVLRTMPQQPVIQKSGSRLSPALQHLYDNTMPARKAEPREQNPVPPGDALDK